MIDYSIQGGYSPFKTTAVHVQGDGHVTVNYHKYNQPPKEYSCVLNNDEIASIANLVDTVKLFDQPSNEANRMYPLDVGISTLVVSVGNKQGKFEFIERKELKPLTEALHKLINQGVVTTELQEDGDTYNAMVAVSLRLVGRKVFSPRLLIEPLKKEIESNQDHHKQTWGLIGLSWILNPTQWHDYVSELLSISKAERRTQFLHIYSAGTNYTVIFIREIHFSLTHKDHVAFRGKKWIQGVLYRRN